MYINHVGARQLLISVFFFFSSSPRFAAVVLMRVKRSAEPMRSFSFSGFNPNGQMAAFSGMSEYPMFANYGPPSQAGPYNYGPAAAGQDSYGPPTQDSYGPPPSGVAAEQPAASAADPNKKQPYGAAGNQQQPQEYGQRPEESQDSNSAEQTNNKKPYKGECSTRNPCIPHKRYDP